MEQRRTMAVGPGERFEAQWTTHPVMWHVAFWAIHILNEQLIAVAERRAALAVLGGSLTLYAMLALAAYANLLLLVPTMWRRGRRATYALAFVLTCALIAFAWVAFRRPTSIFDGGGLRAVLRWTFTCMMYAGSAAALDVAARHIRAARDRAEREREHAQRRLDRLCAQLNPHFLFNTLNSLYSLAVMRSPILPEMILQHAGLLRYSLDQTRHARVPLGGEVEFMAAYVALERLRLSDGADVRLEVEGVVGDQRIAPMIFAPLVENCFKHLGSAAGPAPFVHICLDVLGERVQLSLRNTRDPDAGTETRSGIGLHNTRERLALLYPGRHRLEACALGDTFDVELSLEL
jgi:hypothetical protein